MPSFLLPAIADFVAGEMLWQNIIIDILLSIYIKYWADKDNLLHSQKIYRLVRNRGLQENLALV